MPVEVPKEPKKLTTIYDNFKGVDYTNDASNSYRRRSPSGKNMLPDLDGVPHKRPGWEVAVKAEDFITALDAPDYSSLSTYNVGDFAKHDGITYACKTKIETPMAWNEDYWKVASVTPNRTHYFSYGGYDYLMIFNSLGVFWMKEGDATPTLADLASGDNIPYTITTFPPPNVPFPADHNRAFFFEGDGVSGFYVFVANSIYRFCEGLDGAMHFFSVEAKIPTVITGANPGTGAGTDNESINLLTGYRTIEYFGEQGATDYNIKVNADPETISVSILNTVTGVWDDIPPDHSTYSWTYDDGKVTFDTAPPASIVGNVRITCSPINSGVFEIENNKHTKTGQIVSTRTYKRVRVCIFRCQRVKPPGHYRKEYLPSVSSSEVIGTYIRVPKSNSMQDILASDKPTFKILSINEFRVDDYGYEYTYGGVTLGVSNPKSTDDIVTMSDYIAEGDYEDVSDKVQVTYDSYNSSITVTPNDTDIFNEDYPYGRTSETTINGGEGAGTGYYWRNTVDIGDGYSLIEYTHTEVITVTKVLNVYGVYTKYSGDEIHEAFSNCRKSLTFGNNIYNQAFISACDRPNYRNRAWYSAVNNPAYFPDTNYIEAGADDKAIMGLIKVGSYLGIIKMGSGTEASIYLAYATSFDEESTYAVKQSVSGIGAVSVGAFNILNGEPLFLSSEGVMGIDLSEESEDKQVRNRSFFVNKKLCNEPKIGIAVSFIYKGMYYLAVDGRCYVLDGSQKSSWANEKTNLQYECYYLENIPAQCFAKMGDRLYFNDYKGNLCRFKKLSDPYPYVDTYSVATPTWTYDVVSPPATIEEVSYTDINDTDKTAKVGDTMYVADGRYYTIVTEYDEDDNVEVMPGVPIEAQWDTIADDDGMVHFFKNLTKKGCVVSFMPDSNGVDVYLKADEKEPVYIGTMPTTTVQLPSEGYVRKKIKKYKRLQIICKNNRYNEGFAIDQIIKTYTVGNYSKNRG